jgi:hypothetical protein
LFDMKHPGTAFRDDPLLGNDPQVGAHGRPVPRGGG